MDIIERKVSLDPETRIFKAQQTNGNNLLKERQESERFTLEARNVHNPETGKVDRCYLYGIVEYWYASGRSKWSSSYIDLSPTDARMLAAHLNDMADRAEAVGAAPAYPVTVTYRDYKGSSAKKVRVYVEGQYSGDIVETMRGKFKYVPKGKMQQDAFHGNEFNSIDAVKMTLEGK